MDKSVAERAPELTQLSVERVRGIVHYSFQLPTHPPLCHRLHTAGFPNQFVQLDGTTAPDSTSPAHCCKEYDAGYHRLVDHSWQPCAHIVVGVVLPNRQFGLYLDGLKHMVVQVQVHLGQVKVHFAC